MVKTCDISNDNLLIFSKKRLVNGDIKIVLYCYRDKDNNSRVSHTDCLKSLTLPNGLGLTEFINEHSSQIRPYKGGLKITNEGRYPNLIGCWCDDNARFSSPVEAQNHRLYEHPEEFEE